MNVENDKNSDEEFEEEEEELLLYLDFQSKIKPETLQKPNVQIKVIGLETNEPIVQINNKVFRGVFEHAMGTNIFFAENTDPPPMDPNFESIPSTMYKYHSQTDKVLKMERIFITPKQDNDEDDDTTEEQCEEDDIPNESYLEALNHFLKPRELPPRTMSGSDILKPAEFKAFFRPQLDEVAVDEQSEQVNDSMETNDNNEMIETSASEASGSATTELSAAQVKIENIKLEQQ